jgi:hypothetical protein
VSFNPGHFAPKVDQKTYAAIKEAREAEMAPSVVMRKLAGGTLPGIDGPVEIKKRTFFEKWARAKRELARAAEPKDDGPSFLDQLRVAMEDWEDLSPEELGVRCGWEPEYAKEILEALAAGPRYPGRGPNTRACAGRRSRER